ncbi:MAG: MFS transporter [Euryarchaeota archaeon]|nr:MFS transporter [Euryarchaeota archaeon]MDE1837816.1 MFS transporter [Euryarchaeota archaeon]MDE1880090.1 MFS transporter [Euryarchaeota archaeon]MDE2045072.1 MFS transporter [Thermoplasmata archaeon]
MFKELSELRHIASFRRVFLPLSATFFVYTFGWGIVSPIFSIYVNQVTGSPTLTGLVLSLTTMAGIFLNIPFGILEDRLNMKRVLQVTLLAYAGLAVLYPLAHTVPSLIALSIARGVASSFLWLTSWAYVLSYAEKQVKGKETGFFSDMNDLASAVSPVLGGFVALLSFFLPFYLLAVTSLAACGIATAFLHESPPPQRTPWRTQVDTVARYFRDRRFVKTILLVVVFYAIINVYYGFLAILLNGEGLGYDAIGVVLTVALAPAVALEVPMGNLVDRIGIRRTLAIAIAATAGTALLIPFSGDLYYALVVVTAFTVSYTAIFIALYSRMSDVMQKDKVAMTGAIATFKDLGYTLGPLSAGFLIPVVGLHGTFLGAGAAFLVLLPLALTLHD